MLQNSTDYSYVSSLWRVHILFRFLIVYFRNTDRESFDNCSVLAGSVPAWMSSLTVHAGWNPRCLLTCAKIREVNGQDWYDFDASEQNMDFRSRCIQDTIYSTRASDAIQVGAIMLKTKKYWSTTNWAGLVKFFHGQVKFYGCSKYGKFLAEYVKVLLKTLREDFTYLAIYNLCAVDTGWSWLYTTVK